MLTTTLFQDGGRIMAHLRKNGPWMVATMIVITMLSLPVMAAEPLTVGVVHREGFAYAAMMRTAFEMAREEINAADGIQGRPLALVYADDKGDVKAGERAIRNLVEEQGAVMLVGGYSSSNTLSMAYAANRLDIPFLVCTAADDRITQHNLKNIYRLNPPVSEYTKGLEEFLLERVLPESMSIIYENSPFGTGSAMRMMWFCRENDILIKAIQPYFKKGATPDYLGRMLMPIKKDPPQVLFMAAYLEDAVMLVNKVRELEIDALLCGGAGGFTHDDFSRRTGNASEHLLTATLWSPSAKDALSQAFGQRFAKRHGTGPDYHAAEAYSALLVTAEALRQSRSLAPADIRTALDATTMKTPFGEVAFSDYGSFRRQNVSQPQVFQIINGRFETVWPQRLATQAYIQP
jgi:branched-chain amino acid transport system substrate-binding protein